ncbi:MAG: hypothetical protein WBB19_10290 [Desulforhopalus sp.]
MKRIFPILFTIFIISSIIGCVSAPSQREIAVASVAKVYGSNEFLIMEVPSHGLIGDSVAIAAGGGGNASQVRSALLEFQKAQGVQRLAITSSNSLLAKTVLSSAVKKLPADSLTNIQIAFVGDVAQGEEIRSLVEATGAQFDVVGGK